MSKTTMKADAVPAATAASVRRSREELLGTLAQILRKVSAQSVLISDTVAKRVGLNSTDLECLDLLSLAGPTTAGQLAVHTGLTTGAMTAVIDRLERAGFVRRRRDPNDRRRVLVTALPRSVGRIQPLYAPFSAALSRLHEQYGTAELAVVVDYLSHALAVSAEHVNWLNTQPPRPRPKRSGTARRP